MRRAATAVILLTLTVLLAPTATASGGDLDTSSALGFDLDRATIPDLHRLMAAGQLTSVQLTAAYLHRIRTVDRQVHAVITTDPTAPHQAEAADHRRRAGHPLGPLDGIPVLLKDNVDTAGLATTAGSRALLGPLPARDAALVTRLRAAGAVILGKTNLSEWANFRDEKATSGWSGVGGQTANPYVLDHNPCGSSSGSAAAVAASLAQVAVGTETDGSIVCPAGANGLVGHKPSLGLVSRTGVVPISAQQDTAGPIARHVVDAAILLGALQGRDPADPATADYPADQPTDYTALDPDALRGARIGLWAFPGADPDVDRVTAATADLLRQHGATVINVTLPYQDRIGELELPALLTEFHRDIDHYLATRTGVPRDLAALIAHNDADPAERTCFPGQSLFQQALTAPGPDDPGYRATRAEATDLARRSIDETLAAHHLDAIVTPTNGPAWRTDCATGDQDVVSSSTPAAVAGYPATTVPAGFAGPLPLGVSFMAGRWADLRVLRLAAAFEQASDARRPPRYLPTLPGS